MGGCGTECVELHLLILYKKQRLMSSPPHTAAALLGSKSSEGEWTCEGERWPFSSLTRRLHLLSISIFHLPRIYKYSWKCFFPLILLHKPNPTLCSPQSHWRIEYGAVDAHEPCSRATGWLTGCQLIKALDSQWSVAHCPLVSQHSEKLQAESKLRRRRSFFPTLRLSLSPSLCVFLF